MNLYVPDIGDTLKLAKDWKFYLQQEHRQHLDLEQFGTGKSVSKDSIQFYRDQENFNEVIIPKGSVIKVDRVYIRKGASGFSSISFILIETGGKKIKAQRFWAHLRECNKIEFEHGIKDVKIQWPYANIFKGKESLPRPVAGLDGVFRHDIRNSLFERFHVNIHRYEKVNSLQGQIDGENIPFLIRENIEIRPLSEDEKRRIRESNYYKNSYFYGSNALDLNKSKKINEALDNALRIVDWDLEIVNESGEVVKTYKSLNSAKKWIKDELQKQING
jgi:hypothetical protein